MSELTQERVQLLSKLYNLKSEDSVIIKDITNRQKENEENKRDKENVLTETINERNTTEEQLTTFEEQASQAIEAFGSYDNDSFSSLSLIGIDFGLGDKLKELKEKKDGFIDETNEKIKNLSSKIEDINSEIDELDEKSQDIKEELSKANQQKSKLGNLLEDIIDNENDSYNRGYVRNVLESFEFFTSAEVEELELLIIFPEKGLKEFDSQKLYKNPSNFIPAEPKEEVKEEIKEEEKKEEQVEEPTIELDESEPEISTEEENISINIPEEPKEDDTQIIVEDEKEENIPVIEETNEEENDLFSKTEEDNKGFIDDFQGFPSFNEFLARADEKYGVSEEQQDVALATEEPVVEEPVVEDKVIEKLGIKESEIPENNRTKIITLIENSNAPVKANYDMLKVLELNDSEIFNVLDNDYMYITDEELISKITTLRGQGINDKAIKEEILNGNFKVSLNEIRERLSALKEKDNVVSNENINQLKNEVDKCEKNVKTLYNNGIDLEDIETRNYTSVLCSADQIQNQINYLKDYSIKLVRKNGKYALEPFWKKPKDIAVDIDDLLEADLSNLIESYPEVLGKNVETIQRRIKYCLENDIPIVDENNSNVFYKYIYDEYEFHKMFGNVSLPSINSMKDNNSLLSTLINGDYVEKLDSYYSNEIDNAIELSDDNYKVLENILKKVPTILGATLDGLVYRIGDEALVSKNKLERNAAFLIDAISKEGKNANLLDKEIILSSAFFNSRTNQMIIKKIVTNGLSKTGGM